MNKLSMYRTCKSFSSCKKFQFSLNMSTFYQFSNKNFSKIAASLIFTLKIINKPKFH